MALSSPFSSTLKSFFEVSFLSRPFVILLDDYPRRLLGHGPTDCIYFDVATEKASNRLTGFSILGMSATVELPIGLSAILWRTPTQTILSLKLKLRGWNPWLGGSQPFVSKQLFDNWGPWKRMLQRSIKSVLEVTWRFRTCQQNQGRRTRLPPQPPTPPPTLSKMWQAWQKMNITSLSARLHGTGAKSKAITHCSFLI